MKNYFIYLFVCGCLTLSAGAVAEEFSLNYSKLLNLDEAVLATPLAQAGIDQNRTSLDMSQRQETGKRVSMKKAMLLSMLFPGAGQYYADSKFKGQLFMGAEVAIWAGFVAYRVYGSWKRSDYKDYAAAYAGVDNSGKDDEFYDWVGFYDSREEFNQYGRLYYPERNYLPDDSQYDWEWDSPVNRVEFKNMKDDSKRAFRNATFMIGLAIANRVIAGIDTYRTVKSAQKKIKSLSQIGEYHFALSPKLFGDNPRVNLTISRRF
jgi:hypothetical protein